MIGITKSVLKYTVLATTVLGLAGCGLPRSGPTKNEVFKSSVSQEGSAFVVEVDNKIARVVNVGARTSFSPSFRNAGPTNVDILRSGDRLQITVYENVEAGVLGTAGIPSVLSTVEVDQRGYVFVPYAGLVRAAGRRTEDIRRQIANRLASQTPDPQVSVFREVGSGSSVAVIGTTAQGVFPLDQSVKHLTEMLARAGGVPSDAGSTKVTVVRGSQRGSIWLDDLYSNPTQDIHLRDGDRIIIEEDKRTISILGATTGQGLVEFPKPEMSVAEAVAFAGGLNVNIADPTGVFVIRDELPNVANSVTGGTFGSDQRFAYVIDMTRPEGLFIARDFQLRDGDLVYVTEAPYAQFSRILSTLLAPASSLGAARNLTAQ